MTSHAALSLAPASITRRLRKADAPVLFTRVHTRPGFAAEVVCENDNDARACSAVLLQAGYEVAARKGYGQLVVTLPEPVAEGEVVPAALAEQDAPRQDLDGEFRETATGLRYLTADEVAAERAERAEQPAPVEYATLGGHTLARLARRGDAAAKAEQRWRANRVLGMDEPRPATSTPSAAAPVEPAGVVTYRKVGEGLYEVALDGVAIGRVARTTLAHATFGVRWASYTTAGTRIASGRTSRAHAAAEVVRQAAEVAKITRRPARITTREELIERQTARGVSLERATMVADARDALQAELTRNAPAIARVLDEPLSVAGCDCSAVPGPHLAHCDDCTAPADRCVCDAPAGRLAARYDDEEVERLAGSSAPGWGVAQRVLVVDGVDHAEAEVNDDPREQPAPVEWSEHAGA